MNGIGHNDVESYVRTLVSEGFGKQFEDATGSAGPSGDPDPTSPPSVGYAGVIVLDRSPRICRRIMPTITTVLKPKIGMPDIKKASWCG
jgi:hypothetical protein